MDIILAYCEKNRCLSHKVSGFAFVISKEKEAQEPHVDLLLPSYNYCMTCTPNSDSTIVYYPFPVVKEPKLDSYEAIANHLERKGAIVENVDGISKRLSEAIKNLDKGGEIREKELKPEQYGDLWRVTPKKSRNKQYVSIVLKNASV